MGGSISVALVGSNEVAKELGKKGTSSDITLFNAVRDGHAATVVEATQFPEKLPPLLYALGMADRALLVVPALSREVAEAAAALDLFDLPVELVLGAGAGEEEVRRAFKGTRLESAPSRPLDLPALRASLDAWTGAARDGPVTVPIDHTFPVKGVGTVALGVVRRGTLRQHERLRLYPLEKEVEVRSIQVHDVDVKAAECGERVGVALKGVDAEEVERGHTLAPPGSLATATRLDGEGLRRCRYYRGKLLVGNQVNVLVGLQFVPASVAEVSEERLVLEADRPVARTPGDPVYVADLSVPAGPRIVGRATLRA